MNYRELKESEFIHAGDQIKDLNGVWIYCDHIIGERALFSCTYRRPLPQPTFDESANFDVVAKVSKEAPAMEYEISQHSADEVIYATDTKADDLPMPICWRIGDECVINQDRYIIRNIKEVYTVDQIGNKWSFDANYSEMQRPGKSSADQTKDEIRGMLSSPTSSNEKIVELIYQWSLTKES